MFRAIGVTGAFFDEIAMTDKNQKDQNKKQAYTAPTLVELDAKETRTGLLNPTEVIDLIGPVS